MNKVRRREVNLHPDEWKGSRYARLKNKEHRTESQEEIFKAMQEANLEIRVAWRLREEFKALFHCRSDAEAEKNIDLWIDRVKKTGRKEVIKVATMFKLKAFVTHFVIQSNAGGAHEWKNSKKSKRLEEGIEDLEISGLLFFSSVED